MVREVLESIKPVDKGVYVDGTFGAGGHTSAILDAANCKVIGIDRDHDAIKKGLDLSKRYSDRLMLVNARFGDLEKALLGHGFSQVNGITLDLGVSSMQINTSERGFSFQNNGPLDMRMGCVEKTAADLINSIDEKGLEEIIWRFGEERHARRLAREIIKARNIKPIATTADLSSIVSNIVRKRSGKIHPATRTFQALRIAVNDEQKELRKVLLASEKMLAPEAKLVIISFHSLEDRLVKNFLTERSVKNVGINRYQPDLKIQNKPTFKIHGKLKKPSESEIANNPRARSAKLRAAVRTDAKPWASGEAA